MKEYKFVIYIVCVLAAVVAAITAIIIFRSKIADCCSGLADCCTGLKDKFGEKVLRRKGEFADYADI